MSNNAICAGTSSGSGLEPVRESDLGPRMFSMFSMIKQGKGRDLYENPWEDIKSSPVFTLCNIKLLRDGQVLPPKLSFLAQTCRRKTHCHTLLYNQQRRSD